MIYLASPYTHHNAKMQLTRANAAGKIAAHFIRQGKYTISPVIHGHYTEAQVVTPIPYNSWIEFGIAILSKCSEMYVLEFPGWERSTGIAKEIETAAALNIPITRIDWETCKPLLYASQIHAMEQA